MEASTASELTVKVSSGGVTSTTTMLASSANPSTFNQSVTFTASVTGNNPTGTVAFTESGNALAGCSAVALTGSGNTRTAACTNATLAVGVHSIVAAYGGNASNGTSTSAVLSQSVEDGHDHDPRELDQSGECGRPRELHCDCQRQRANRHGRVHQRWHCDHRLQRKALAGSGNSRTAACVTSRPGSRHPCDRGRLRGQHG